MAQHDFNIDNQSAPAFRGDLNNALEALVTLSSNATAPATTYAGMFWHDTAVNTLYIRSDADDAWIALGTLDQSANTFAPAGVAELTQVQAEDDTSTVFGQVSGERLAQAVAANVVVPDNHIFAWVQFSSTGAIQDSFGVSSVVRTATGRFTVTWSTAQPDDNYYTNASGYGFSGSIMADPNTTTATLEYKNLSNSFTNPTQGGCVAIRSL